MGKAIPQRPIQLLMFLNLHFGLYTYSPIQAIPCRTTSARTRKEDTIKTGPDTCFHFIDAISRAGIVVLCDCHDVHKLLLQTSLEKGKPILFFSTHED